jgi:hypothetical protein
MTRTHRLMASLVAAFVAFTAVAGLGPHPATGQLIGDDVTWVTLTVAPGPETAIGTELTITAVVEGGEGQADAGLMTLLDDGVVDSATIDATGTATFTYAPPTVGLHELRAVYHGDPPTHGAAASEIVTHTVTGDPPTVPTVLFSVTPPQEAPHDAAVELRAVITDPAPTGGTVAFRDGDTVIATALVATAAGVASATANVTLPQGVRHLSARYLGDLPEIGPAASAGLYYSALPATCADQAQPGNGALVRLGYIVSLGRCPDAAGFAYWTGRLDAGASPALLGQGLALSAEGTAATVDAAYREVLDRPADPAGRAVWAAKLRTGWTTSQLWAALAASPEFVAGAPGALVDRAYDRLVGRPVDDASRPYWEQRLAAGPRSGALRALVLTPEALDRRAQAASELVRSHPVFPDEGYVSGIKVRRGDWRLLVADLLTHPSAAGHAHTYPDLAG